MVMKRMYVTLGVMFLLLFWAFSSLGQKKTPETQEEKIMKRMQMREEIHRRLIDQLMKGGTPPDDMFADMEQMMNQVMSESLSGLDNFQSNSQNFSTAWSESGEGRTLAITPKSPEQQLDINVKDGFVTVQGKVETKSQYGTSVSSFNNSFNVPGDCDPTKVKMDHKDGKILLHFPFRTATKSITKEPKIERTPVPPSKEDVPI